ncbi:MAG: 2'-5' RNA ligase family protein [Gaiellaceae bacterium]
MKPAASVQAGERVRLFCGLRLPGETADAIVAWQLGLDGGRPVPRGNLHFTLAFLGWQPRGRIAEVVDVLRGRAAETEPPVFMLERYRETRSVGMLVFSRDEGAERLALGLQRDLLGSSERESWLPHVTVLRFSQRPRLRPVLPELGRVVPSDAAAYLSRLRPGGAEYVVLQDFPLGTKTT